MPKREKREYSTAYTPKGPERHQLTFDRVPGPLYRRIKGKAKREGVSLRALVLTFLDEWSSER
jgi:hypothetical protein